MSLREDAALLTVSASLEARPSEPFVAVVAIFKRRCRWFWEMVDGVEDGGELVRRRELRSQLGLGLDGGTRLHIPAPTPTPPGSHKAFR